MLHMSVQYHHEELEACRAPLTYAHQNQQNSLWTPAILVLKGSVKWVTCLGFL